jgi:predicted ATP-grasp superfamily ATP-dependent carboligase
MPNILVLDANQRSALAAIRSLGRRGMRVIAGDHVTPTLGAASRYAVDSVLYADPARSAARFVEEVSAAVRRFRIDTVLPATDLTTMLLVSQPESIRPARLAAPSPRSYEALTDKRALIELARTVDVATPDTRVARTPAEIRDAAEEFGYPLVLKPARSRYLRGDQVISTAVRVIDSAAELPQTAAALPYLEDLPCLVQRFIPGHGAGIFAFCGPDGPAAWFAHKRIREKPPSGGVSVLSESVAVDPAMQAMAARLLSASRWSGVAMIEFRITPAGVPYLMEVNGRLWGSLQLAIDCGVDFPRLLCELVSEPATAWVAPPAYVQGRRLRWLLGDVDNLILQARASGHGAADKLGAAGSFLGSFFDLAARQEVFRWSDPRPGLREARSWLGALLP